MSPQEFRRLALALAGTVEAAHMNHPDFRVEGRVFASLGHPDEASAMVRLTPEQQASYAQSAPAVFSPSAGAWGRQGYTRVLLPAAEQHLVQAAIQDAWSNAREAAQSKRTRRRPRAGRDA